jgi:hypothetical protein
MSCGVATSGFLPGALGGWPSASVAEAQLETPLLPQGGVPSAAQGGRAPNAEGSRETSRSQEATQKGACPGTPSGRHTPSPSSSLRLIVFAIIDFRSSAGHPLGNAVETFVRREDAERFIEEVRGDDPGLAEHWRIEERGLG